MIPGIEAPSTLAVPLVLVQASPCGPIHTFIVHTALHIVRARAVGVRISPPITALAC